MRDRWFWAFFFFFSFHFLELQRTVLSASLPHIGWYNEVSTHQAYTLGTGDKCKHQVMMTAVKKESIGKGTRGRPLLGADTWATTWKQWDLWKSEGGNLLERGNGKGYVVRGGWTRPRGRREARGYSKEHSLMQRVMGTVWRKGMGPDMKHMKLGSVKSNKLQSFSYLLLSHSHADHVSSGLLRRNEEQVLRDNGGRAGG